MPLSYAIVGDGRMGQAIAAVADARGHRRVATARDVAGLAGVIAARPDVAFEFTRPDVARDNVERLLARGVDVVCGTTGWEPDAALERALVEGGAALIVEPNYSLGVQIFLRLVSQAARLAARLDSHDPAISEWHHRGKLDVPSGTALRMAALVRDVDPRIERIVEDRDGRPTPAGSMPIVGVRVGHEPGRHQFVLDGAHDRLVIEHGARSREGFALGAVRVAEWIDGRSGRLSLESVIEAQLGCGESRSDGGRT